MDAGSPGRLSRGHEMGGSESLRSALGPAFLSMWLAAALACATQTPRGAEWVIATTPHFEILGAMSQEETLALARELERFHRLVHTMADVTAYEWAIPTQIFVFDRKVRYRRYAGPRARSVGFFRPGLRANMIVLSNPPGRMDALTIGLHEYVHQLTRGGEQTTLPIWYDEGLAEFLSTARERDGMMIVGSIPRSRVAPFVGGAWLPFDRIISVRGYGDLGRREAGSFYLQSWALVHYLTLDRANGRSLKRDLARYVTLTRLGVSADEAFEEAFGEDTTYVGRRIEEMLEDQEWRVIGIPLDRLEGDRAEAVVRRPGPAEVAVRLGSLALSSNRLEVADEKFRSALSLAPDLDRANAGLGDVLKFAGELEAAEPHFRRAVELGPNGVLNVLDLGEYLYEAARAQSSAVERRRLLGEARAEFRRAIELEPTNPEAWAMLGWTHLAPGEDPRRAITPLERGLALLPSSVRLHLLMAEARLALGDDRRAANAVALALSRRAGHGFAKSVGAELDAIRERREQEARRAQAGEAVGSPR